VSLRYPVCRQERFLDSEWSSLRTSSIALS
jgi:hypothetical protein